MAGGDEEAVGVDGPLGSLGDDDLRRRYCWWPNCGGFFYPAAALGGGRPFGFCQVATCYDSFANTRARWQASLEGAAPGPSVFPSGPAPKWGLFPVQPPGPPPGFGVFAAGEEEATETEGDEAFVGEEGEEGDGEEVPGPPPGFGVIDVGEEAAVKVEDEEEEAVVGGTASASSGVPEDNETNKLLINN